MMTLDGAIDHTAKTRWYGNRGLKSTLSQVTIAVATLRKIDPLVNVVTDVTRSHLLQAVAMWQAQGLAPATITRRLQCLSAIGVPLCGVHVRTPKRPKWWLNPEVQAQLVHCKSVKPATLRLFCDYVDWTVHTGLRVEETLRLVRSDFADNFTRLLVPGTKTNMANSALPLGADAAKIARDRLDGQPFNTPMFDISYDRLAHVWEALREEMGLAGRPGVTLKAFRRTAARYLHYDRKMPLDLLRQYLRHENINTTMEYLRLTGGASEDEMRRFL